MSFKFQRKLVEIPNTHLRFVRPRCDYMVAVSSCLDAITGLRKLEALYQLYGSLYLVLYDPPLPFALCCSFSCKPIWQGRRRSSGCAVYGVNPDIIRIWDHFRFMPSSKWFQSADVRLERSKNKVQSSKNAQKINRK